jgi:hypothetical protein
MPRTHLMIVTPCYGGMVTAAYASSVSQLEKACQACGIATTWSMIAGHAMITIARAEMVATVLDSPDATHLLSVDADIAFRPEQAFRLLDCRQPFVGAVYPYKTVNWSKAATAIAEGRPQIPSASLDYVVNWQDERRIAGPRGFAKAKYIGAGFMLLRREVLTALRDAHPELRFHYWAAQHGGTPQAPHARGPDRYGLFEPIIDKETGQYLPEDLSFCRRWTDLGGEIWVDMESRLDHLGLYTFKGDLSTQFVRREAP